jgi:DNA helicase HerA-like ATPase
VLALGAYLAVGEVIPREVWFASGLLAVVVNPVLLEPFYPRPYDVVANCILAALLIAWSDRAAVEPGWIALLIFIAGAAVLAVLALLFGASRRDPPGFARSSRTLSSYATSKVIYSSVFWLSLMETFPVTSTDFWILGVTWSIVIVLGSINWQQVWTSVVRAPQPARIEGLAGPGTLLVSAGDLPVPGRVVRLETAQTKTEGVVVTRIRRLRDTWGQVHVSDPTQAEALLNSGSVTLVEADSPERAIVGSVGAGSSERRLVFTSASPLEVGEVVAVRMETTHVLYQLESASVEEMKVRGGSHLVVSAAANQVGRFDPVARRLRQHRWTPEPGAAVLATVPPAETQAPVPASLHRLGSVIGTDIPVYLDLETACEGHIVILGMTKMGKTTLALRLARALAGTRGVVILDQTGEYSSKRHVPTHVVGQWSPGFSVHEPPHGAVGPDFALEFVGQTADLAAAEYQAGVPTPRSIMLEEAHQFIPEPAGLAFQTPGRDSAYQLGVDIMQLRKYGISMTLVSQRTAVVAKSALSQCETMIAFRSVDQTGLDYLEQIAGGGVRNILPALRQGEALVLGTAVSSDRPVAITVDP